MTRALRAWAINRRGKISVRNLRYGPRTRLLRSIYPLPMFLQKMMQHVQNAAAGFVLNRYCSEEDDLKLGWLPTLENTQLNILKLGHSALYDNNNNWPEYLTLARHNPSRTLRSSSAPLLQISLLKGTFQDSVANLYNDLPASISSIPDYHHFVKERTRILKAKAIMLPS